MKQKKTILFGITNNFFKEQLSLISTELISRGYNVIILTNSKKVNSYFLINNPDVRSIYLPKAGRSLGLKYSDTALDKLFKKYNFDQEQFFFRETKILGRKKKCLRHYCFPILSYLDRFFEEEKIDYFVNCGEALSNIMMWRVSKKTNLEYFHTTWVGYIDNMHYWDSDLNRISWIKPEFLRKKLSKGDLKIAEDFLSGSKKGQKVQGFEPRKVFTYYFFKKYLMYLYNYISTGPARMETYSPPTLANLWISRFFKRIYYRSYYKKFDKDEKYFYFPLHLYYDAIIALTNQEFYRQDEAIKMVAKNIPKDHIIITKEHPVLDGTMPFDMMSAISKLDNVKIVNPHTNSHEIIKNSSGVITIASSVGWEAMQYSKPVITLADTFFDYKNLTRKAKSEDELKKLSKQAAEGKLKFKRQDLLQYTYSFVKSHQPNDYFAEDSLSFDRRAKNIRGLADAIEAEIKYRESN
ncbi:TPA: hypothetical protein H1008_00385 [archaeon]|nr:hypothetical protein [Candidatus Undinarchaeales archaeon SRR5007147.bin71]